MTILSYFQSLPPTTVWALRQPCSKCVFHNNLSSLSHYNSSMHLWHYRSMQFEILDNHIFSISKEKVLKYFFLFHFPALCIMLTRREWDIWPVIIHNLKKSCCHQTVVILQRYKKYMKSWGMRKPWQCHKYALFIWFKRSLLRHIRSYYKGAVLIRLIIRVIW